MFDRILVGRGAGFCRSAHRLRRMLGRIGALGFATASAIVGLLASAAPAEATTINTYSFTQDGYYVDSYGFSATLQGTFSGSVESDGLMNLAGLTAFQVSLTLNYLSGTYTLSNIGMPTFFSFNTSGGNSSLAVLVAIQDDPLALGHDLCIGSATFLKCGVSNAAGAYSTYPFVTSAFPKVTLTSSTAVTPIPAPILLFATALAGLFGLFGTRARRQQRLA